MQDEKTSLKIMRVDNLTYHSESVNLITSFYVN